jgi:hypothetical protein
MMHDAVFSPEMKGMTRTKKGGGGGDKGVCVCVQ